MSTDLREVTPVATSAGDRERAYRSERRRFVLAVVAFALVFTAIGRLLGEDIALALQKTPTTTLGWRLIGWLVAGPPFLVAMVTWHERRLLRPRQRRDRSHLLAVWIGLNMFILPARTFSVDSQFGTGALVGDPLSGGWAWAVIANLVAFGFAAVVLLVLHRTVDVPTAQQRDLTVRFLERAWLVLLLVSLGFALYGGGTGVVRGGS